MASSLTPEQARHCVSYGLAVGWIKPGPKPMTQKEIVNFYTRERERLRLSQQQPATICPDGQPQT